jgi:multidrug resistance efflux pump
MNLKDVATAWSRKLSKNSAAEDAPNLERRALSIAAVSAAPLLKSGFRIEHKDITDSKTATRRGKADSVRLVAPRDCFIVKLVMLDGSDAKKGDLLASLDTENEDNALDRLALAENFLTLQERAISDEQLEIRRMILRSTVETAKTYVIHARRMSLIKANEEQAGTIELGTTDLSRTTAVRAEAEWERAKIALDLFEFNSVQAAKKLEFIRAQLDSEKVRYKKQRERMFLRSPIDGTVKINSFEGAYLPKGTVVIEIV